MAEVATLRERLEALERHVRRLDVERSDEDSLLSIQAVHALVDLSPRQIQRRVEDGTFPKPISLGGRRVWPKARVKSWIRDQVRQGYRSA